jgi:hypothetical protein
MNRTLSGLVLVSVLGLGMVSTVQASDQPLITQQEFQMRARKAEALSERVRRVNQYREKIAASRIAHPGFERRGPSVVAVASRSESPARGPPHALIRAFTHSQLLYMRGAWRAELAAFACHAGESADVSQHFEPQSSAASDKLKGRSLAIRRAQTVFFA